MVGFLCFSEEHIYLIIAILTCVTQSYISQLLYARFTFPGHVIYIKINFTSCKTKHFCFRSYVSVSPVR